MRNTANTARGFSRQRKDSIAPCEQFIQRDPLYRGSGHSLPLPYVSEGHIWTCPRAFEKCNKLSSSSTHIVRGYGALDFQRAIWRPTCPLLKCRSSSGVSTQMLVQTSLSRNTLSCSFATEPTSVAECAYSCRKQWARVQTCPKWIFAAPYAR